MKHSKLIILFAILISMVSTKVSASDFTVINSDGVTISYKITSNSSVSVTYPEYDYSWLIYSGDIIIPESVEYKGKTYSVTSIGNYAFKEDKITSVKIPNSVTNIGEEAFMNCYSLISIEIPEGVTSIGERAFYGCNKLSSIRLPKNLTEIERGTFYNCSSLSSINMPKSITYIGTSAFYNCNIDKVIIEDLSTWCNIQLGYKIEEGTNTYFRFYTNPLYNSKHLYIDENTEITTLEIPEGVTEISECAFCGCAGLKEVIMPKSLKNIKQWAFRECGLTSINIPSNVKDIVNNAFQGCNNLTSVELHCRSTPSFSGISSIKTLTIGDEVEYLSGFDGCTGLTSINIPNGVKSIGNEAFKDCSSLNSISLLNSNTSIGEDAFTGTAWFNNQSDGIIYIGKIAFKYKGTVPENADIVIKEGTEIISNSAFRNCTGLTSITIPNSLTSIEYFAFEGCSGLTSVHISDLAAWCKIPFSPWSSNPLSYAHHLYLNGEEIKDLVIPNSVTTIGDLAFSGCSGLTSVTIPNSVTKIGEYNQEIKGETNVEIIPVIA